MTTMTIDPFRAFVERIAAYDNQGAPSGWDLVSQARLLLSTPTTRTRWAAFSGTANGQEITLHPTEYAALWDVAERLGITIDDSFNADDLRGALDDACQGADDWHVQEVTLA